MNPTWTGMIDDAALFPPGDVPLADAVPAHLAHRTAWYRDLVGPFVFPAPRLDELNAALGDSEIAISLTVPAGPEALPGALEALAKLAAAGPAAVEIALPEGMPVERLLAALDRELPAGVPAYVEVPRGGFGPSHADILAAGHRRAKLRTGGTTASAFPSESELAAAIITCAHRGLPFKCTAGLHHAIRHTDPATGFEHHGFLNVLLATEAALDGAGDDMVATVLADRSPDRVRAGIDRLGEAGVIEVRRSFTSIGSCSVLEPVDDLVALGLLYRSAA